MPLLEKTFVLSFISHILCCIYFQSHLFVISVIGTENILSVLNLYYY